MFSFNKKIQKHLKDELFRIAQLNEDELPATRYIVFDWKKFQISNWVEKDLLNSDLLVIQAEKNFLIWKRVFALALLLDGSDEILKQEKLWDLGLG